TPMRSTGAIFTSPAVVTICNSLGVPLSVIQSRTWPAWVVASLEPRVPIFLSSDMVKHPFLMQEHQDFLVSLSPRRLRRSLLAAGHIAVAVQFHGLQYRNLQPASSRARWAHARVCPLLASALGRHRQFDHR